MKSRAFLSVCITVSILIFGALAAVSALAEEGGKAQTLCPIMGGPIDKTAYQDYEGKRVYFCCNGCKAEFLKDPKKYINKMESEGIVLETVPAGKKSPSPDEQGYHRGEQDGGEQHGCIHHGCGAHS